MKKNSVSHLQTILLEDCSLDPRLPLVAGFSGGADSLCMLGMLAELGWVVHAAHFDHHLRAMSGLDAAFAADLARKLGVPFTLDGGDVTEYARVEKLSIEEAARKMRYAFLFETARHLGAQAVCTAHTADDQAETVLMHLMRGSGLAGLKGMQARTIQADWDREILLVRPLLRLDRKETESWCKLHGFKPVVDPSNADPTYTRNRIRLELLPQLETYNPNIRQTLARTADVLNGEYAIVSAAVERAWEDLCRGTGSGWASLDINGLRELEDGRLRGLLRKAAAQLSPGMIDLDFDDIRRAAAFVRKPVRSGESDLACGLRLFIEAERLYVEKPGSAPLPDLWPQLRENKESLLTIPGERSLAGGWAICGERFVLSTMDAFSSDKNEAWLDAAVLDHPLVLRTAQPGERIYLFGMGGKSQKLSDLWINAHVPRRARAAYPLVCCGGLVVWVPGLRLADPFRIKTMTREAIHLQLIKNPA